MLAFQPIDAFYYVHGLGAERFTTYNPRLTMYVVTCILTVNPKMYVVKCSLTL